MSEKNKEELLISNIEGILHHTFYANYLQGQIDGKTSNPEERGGIDSTGNDVVIENVMKTIKFLMGKTTKVANKP